MYNWTRTFVSLYTNAYLQGNKLLNKHGETILTSDSLTEIVRYAAKNASKKPLRTCATISDNERYQELERYSDELRELFKQRNADLEQELTEAEFWENVWNQADAIETPF